MDLKLILLLICILEGSRGLELKNGAYEDFVIKIDETVPDTECTTILANLKETLTSASQYLFSALDSRALFIRSATVLLPPSWPESCSPSAVTGASGETSDITVLSTNPVRGKVYTQQSLGCGQPGDQIFFGYESFLEKDNTLGRSLVKEFAKYRYGVFEEQGYVNDPVHPMCFYDDEAKKGKLTGCSDLPINDNGFCSEGSVGLYNVSQMVDPNARSSIMFAAEAPSVSMFCDHGTHDRFAPTKHNLMCQGRSVLSVITEHPDLKGNSPNNLDSSQIIDTTPKIVYKKQTLTRFVFVIENTKDMLKRESWIYLRLALRHWALHVLPDNTEIGLVLTNSSAPIKALDIVSLKESSRDSNRDKFYSSIPYDPSDSQPGCMHCTIKSAMEMLTERTRTSGPANNVIVAIAPGITVDEHLKSLIGDLKKNQIKVATINYPDVIKPNTLRIISDATGGVDYTVFEKIANVATSSLSTYFELHNVLKDINQRFYSGSQADLPIEVHRRKIVEDGSSSVAGRFMLEPNLGEPAQFTIYTHNTVTPRINQIRLTSPNNQAFTKSNAKYIDFKMITLYSNISETGTWTYNIKHEIENRQPHFLQVTATPKSAKTPVVRASFRTHRNKIGDPLILLATVMFGDKPVVGAKVEVVVGKTETNGTTKFDLLDTGSGDPDVTKGDGVYTRYFNADEWGPGLFTFEVTVTNDIGSAKTWSESLENNDGQPCCGSTIFGKGEQPISPFQRVLPKVSIMISPEEITSAKETTVGRIGDLKVEVVSRDMKARLSWTSPDMGGLQVNKFEIRYATSVQDIVDNFETIAKLWDDRDPFPLEAGSETSFSLDFSQNQQLLDKPLYFAVKSYAKQTPDFSGPVSNWVRVFVPSPPPPPTVAPTYTANEQSFWPNFNSVGIDSVTPTISKTAAIGLELILPIVIGIILLIVLLIVYCYFCVVRKRVRNDQKSAKANAIKKDNLSANITIVPSSPQNISHSVSQTYAIDDIPDPHQVGVPVNNYAYEDETKKRYSLVNQQEQQLIEELKQQQMHQHPPSYAGVSVISNNTITRNGHALSPFNSWSASQLLHEHERRHSPLENMMTEEQIMSHQDALMNGSQMDHMSINGQSMDHMSVNGHQVPEHYPNQILEHYPQGHLPPPVPPLPAFGNGYSVNYSIYGVHQGPPPQQQQNQHQIYQSMTRTEPLVPYNASLQGSMSSVNSGEKKRRNVTMV